MPPHVVVGVLFFGFLGMCLLGYFTGDWWPAITLVVGVLWFLKATAGPSKRR